MDETFKNVFVLGASGVGKSFLLNLLLGSEVGFSDQYFKTGDSNDSCTKICLAKNGTLFGKKNGIKVNLIDMPGLYDNEDPDKETYKMTPSVKHLVNLQLFIANQCNFQINRVLICLDVTGKFDERPKHIFRVSEILMPSKQKVAVVMTKCNQYDKMPESKKQNLYQSWRNRINSMGIDKVFFFGQTLGEVDSGFENDIRESLPTTMRGWTQLNYAEKSNIGKEFNMKIDPSCILI